MTDDYRAKLLGIAKKRPGSDFRIEKPQDPAAVLAERRPNSR
ncbi:hypothetical protein [Bradyrhizobium sp.]